MTDKLIVLPPEKGIIAASAVLVIIGIDAKIERTNVKQHTKYAWQ